MSDLGFALAFVLIVIAMGIFAIHRYFFKPPAAPSHLDVLRAKLASAKAAYVAHELQSQQDASDAAGLKKQCAWLRTQIMLEEQHDEGNRSLEPERGRTFRGFKLAPRVDTSEPGQAVARLGS